MLQKIKFTKSLITKKISFRRKSKQFIKICKQLSKVPKMKSKSTIWS